MKAKRANQPPASLPPIARDEATRRLRALRRLMAAERVDAVIVQATDRFLNEYVAAEGSERIWLSGFTGSAGDLLVTPDEAWLFVDGRYHEQAERELALPPWSIVKLELVTELYSELVARLVELARARSRPLRVGFDPETTSSAQYAQLRARLAGAGATLKTLTPSLVARARGGARREIPGRAHSLRRR